MHFTDLLKKRNKEWQFFTLSLETGQKLVIDNTNPTTSGLARYIDAAKAKNFKVTGYYFNSALADAIRRNKLRAGREQVEEAGIQATDKKLQ